MNPYTSHGYGTPKEKKFGTKDTGKSARRNPYTSAGYYSGPLEGKADTTPVKKDEGFVAKANRVFDENAVLNFLNVSGERFGSNQAKGMAETPEMARWLKPVLSKNADKSLDSLIEKYHRNIVEPGTRVDETLLARNKAADKFGTGLTIAAAVATAAKDVGATVGSVGKIANKLRPGGAVDRTFARLPWNAKKTVSLKELADSKPTTGVPDPNAPNPRSLNEAIETVPRPTPHDIHGNEPAFARKARAQAAKTPDNTEGVPLPARPEPTDINQRAIFNKPANDTLKKNAWAAAAGAKSGSKDAYTITLHALAETNSKTKVRKLLDDLLPEGTTANDKTRAAKAIADSKDPEEIGRVLFDTANPRDNPAQIVSDNLDIPAFQRLRPTSSMEPGGAPDLNNPETPAFMRKSAGVSAPELPVEPVGAPARQTGAVPTSPLVQAIADVEYTAPSPTSRTAPVSEAPTPSTAVPKNQSKLQRAFLSTTGSLSKMGDAGKEMAGKLAQVRHTSETGQAAFWERIPTVKSLSKTEFENFVNALEDLSKGKTDGQISGKVAQAIEEWRTSIPAVRKAADAAGIDVGDLGEYYFPRNYSETLSKAGGMQRAAEQLVKTGKAKSIGEALTTLKTLRKRYGTRFGHLENERKVDLPEYDKTKNALISYIQGTFDRVAHAEQFGAKGEIANELLETMKQGGHEADQAFRNYSIASGTYNYDQPALEGFSKGMRAFNRLRSLGLSAALNITQINNTTAFTGISRSLRSGMKLLNPSEREYVRRTGVVLDSVINDLREQTGVSGKIADKLTAPGFNRVEWFNRSLTALAVRDYANGLAKTVARGGRGAKNAERILREKLGIEGEIGRKLTKEQEIMASRNGVEKTQFKVDAQDLPGWADSPGGKLATQFKTFIYKQNKFVFDEILKEAVTRGNFVPLARFLTVGGVLGYGAGKVRSTLRGESTTNIDGVEDKPNFASELLDAYSNVGAFGLLGDIKFLAQNAKGERFSQYLAGSLGGPTASLGIQTATNLGKTFAGNPQALERQTLSAIPVAGPAISRAAVPFKPQVSDKQLSLIENAPNDDVKQRYYDIFSEEKQNNQTKKKVVAQIKDDIKNQRFYHAQKVGREYNRGVDQRLQSIKDELGEDATDELLTYLSDNRVNYDYYYKKRNEKT